MDMNKDETIYQEDVVGTNELPSGGVTKWGGAI
jgi:hypothetical protein